MSTIPDVLPEVPARRWTMVLGLLRRLPTRAMSRAFGRVADISVPVAARSALFGTFGRAVGINLREVELPLTAYGSLNEFFVRRLRSGLRTWPREPEALASPVDGIVGRSGSVQDGLAIQAKGHTYSVAELLANPAMVDRFQGGVFLTIYLSPRHYHRIHTPAAGTITHAVYVPGSLLPVNAPAVMHVPALFTRNERLVCHLESTRGTLAVVAVGAYNVGRISAAFDPHWSGSGRDPWVTNLEPPAPRVRCYSPPKSISIGDELMAFHLGSTVVLLFKPGVELRDDLVPGTEVVVGERIDT